MTLLVLAIACLGTVLVFLGEHFYATAEIDEIPDKRHFVRITSWVMDFAGSRYVSQSIQFHRSFNVQLIRTKTGANADDRSLAIDRRRKTMGLQFKRRESNVSAIPLF